MEEDNVFIYIYLHQISNSHLKQKNLDSLDLNWKSYQSKISKWRLRISRILINYFIIFSDFTSSLIVVNFFDLIFSLSIL